VECVSLVICNTGFAVCWKCENVQPYIWGVNFSICCYDYKWLIKRCVKKCWQIIIWNNYVNRITLKLRALQRVYNCQRIPLKLLMEDKLGTIFLIFLTWNVSLEFTILIKKHVNDESIFIGRILSIDVDSVGRKVYYSSISFISRFSLLDHDTEDIVTTGILLLVVLLLLLQLLLLLILL